MELNKGHQSVFLRRFNKRDANAFAEIYTTFFTELHVFASRFYMDMSDAEDAVQEAFCYLWERHDVVFDSLERIKAFLFVAIKNRFKNHVTHLEVEQKYRDAVERNFRFGEDILESELTTSLLEYVERMADPERKMLKLYLAGYELEEIAKQMQLSIQTIYNMKSRAVGKLRRFFAVISRQIR